MIKHYFITGDTHGKVLDRVSEIKTDPAETAIIILGDFGMNFYLDRNEQNRKKKLNDTGFTFYAVRGNHEERPENLNIPKVYDDLVQGYVYQEPLLPNIKYFVDGGEYNINGYSTLVIGGAYSVDKAYRIVNYMRSNGWCGWFKDEQLSDAEKATIAANVIGKRYDFIFTHTAPLDYEPIECFSPYIDQSKVDKSMENWLQYIADRITWSRAWCFGHYHDDLTIAPKVKMLYTSIVPLEEL